MGKIWNTMKVGAFAILLSSLSPGNSMAQPPTQKAASRTTKGCNKLETIAKREAAGIPKEYARASQDIVTKLDPKKIKYDCTYIKTNKNGSFNAYVSHDRFTFLGKSNTIWKDYVNLLNTVSENNISRGYPPLVKGLLHYVIKINLINAEQKHNLKTNFEKSFDVSELSIQRKTSKFKLSRTLKGFEARKIHSLKYKKSGLSRKVLSIKRHRTNSKYVNLPLFSQAVIPYVVLKPEFSRRKKVNGKGDYLEDYVKRLRELNKRASDHILTKKKTNKKIKKPLGISAGLGFGFSYHLITKGSARVSLEIGYHKDKLIVGGYASLLAGRNVGLEPSEIGSVGGSVGGYFGVNLEKYFTLKLLAGLAWDNLRVPRNGTIDYEKTFVGAELGAGFCINQIMDNKLRLSYCADYRVRIIDINTPDMETMLNLDTFHLTPYAHGGSLSLMFHF